MTEIELSELTKSKNLMDHIQFTDDITKDTGNEYGFNFCKINNEIIVDILCKGDKCSLDIKPTICDKYDNTFHTHPNKKRSELSVTDLLSSIARSHRGKKTNISCVKAEFDNNVICKKNDVKDINEDYIINSYEEYLKTPTYEKHKEIYDKIENKVKPESILFDSETGRTIYYRKRHYETI